MIVPAAGYSRLLPYTQANEQTGKIKTSEAEHQDKALTIFRAKNTVMLFLIPRSRVLEKITVAQLVKKYPAFYENRRVITVFARVSRKM
jgi:hypothetical protein